MGNILLCDDIDSHISTNFVEFDLHNKIEFNLVPCKELSFTKVGGVRGGLSMRFGVRSLEVLRSIPSTDGWVQKLSLDYCLLVGRAPTLIDG